MTDPLDVLRRQAKTLHKQYDTGDRAAIARVDLVKPRAGELKHADFLHVIARENNFATWPQMKTAVETQGMDRAAKQQRLKIAIYHGQTHVVQHLIWDTPDLADGAFGLQVALYDIAAVRRTLAVDPEAAIRTYGPRRPILHLAFSKMLTAWPDKEADMIAIADMLVQHGADVNDGFPAEPGSDHRLSALYGALGHAHNMPLAQWLVDRGADPNDGECLYHATELGHHEGLRLVIAAGARPEGTNALLHAMDFDDPIMVKMLLDTGADPNEDNGGMTALHHAALRMCSTPVCQLLLDAGADQTIVRKGVTAYSAARVYGHAGLAAMLAPTHLRHEEKLLAMAADGSVPEDVFIDPTKIPEPYVDILRSILHKPGKMPHLRALVGLGVPWDKPDDMGLTPVQIAGWEGLSEVMGYFLGLKPDLGHVNGYGGTLLSTIIHGSENNASRAERDHLTCLRMVLDEGVALPKRAIEFAGDPEIAAFLADWALRHPGRWWIMALPEFAIHSLPVGGGQLAITPMPGRTKHYYTDWLRLLDWSPALVMTMTLQAELDRKGAGTLGTDLTNAGIDWLHLPVPDFGTPIDLDWPAVRDKALGVLARGDRVLVHCFGGCGRSGMMVLRLMIAAGEAPDAALSRLRQVRPCAVETDAQMVWARQG